VTDRVKNQTQDSKHPIFEPVVLVLLSLATVGIAWVSFQAAVWGAASQRAMNLSAVSNHRAAANELKSSQMAMLDVLLFTQYINARAGSNESLANFYSSRFRSEAKAAFDAWMAMHPFENSNAPPHPFVSDLYHPRLLDEAREAEAESQRQWQVAGEAGRNGRSYVLITVMLASTLFCAGTAPKFENRWVRRTVVIFGLGAFVFAVARLLSLPIRLWSIEPI